MLRSVANLTLRDGEKFFELAPTVAVRTTITAFPLEAANEAVDAVRAGRPKGGGGAGDERRVRENRSRAAVPDCIMESGEPIWLH